MKIRILNYSLGNVGSVLSAFEFYGYDVKIVHDNKEVELADLLILAGVGNFPTAISLLKKKGFWDILNKEVLVKKKPILGICLGMQLFADVSYEDGESRGFGWIKGKVVKIDSSQVKVPHIGWNQVKPADLTFFNRMKYNNFYFMHSYHFIVENSENIIATTQYGNTNIVSALRKDNIIGVQFHPEKSQGDGLRLLTNFVEVMYHDK